MAPCLVLGQEANGRIHFVPAEAEVQVVLISPFRTFFVEDAVPMSHGGEMPAKDLAIQKGFLVKNLTVSHSVEVQHFDLTGHDYFQQFWFGAHVSLRFGWGWMVGC